MDYLIARGTSPYRGQPQNLKIVVTSELVKDQQAFEDAQSLASIARRIRDEAFWWAAMQSLKSAYGVK